MGKPAPPLVLTKLRPPVVGQRIIRRPRLESILDRTIDYRVTLVSAGAGYGKTTLLAALPARKASVAWYSIGSSDTDAPLFFSYLSESIAALLDEPLRSAVRFVSPRARTRADFAAQIARLANALSDLVEQNVIIVLDDYHLVERSEPLNSLVDYLITISPANVHFVISSRTSVALPCLPKLRASGQVLNIGQEELRFNEEECAEMVATSHGLDLSHALVEVLVNKSEGWPIGLELMCQMLKGRSSASFAEFLSHFSSSQRPLFDYLAQEVLSQQPRHVQEFLVQSSALSTFDAATCDAILRRKDSAEIIEHLRQNNLILVSADATSFRYHQLLRDFLREQLAHDRKLYAAVHEAAAHHYQRCGNEELAIHHFLLAELYSSAASLISHTAEGLVRVSRFDTLIAWIESLPSTVLEEFPELLVRRAEIDEIRGRYDSALRWYDWAARVYRDKGDLLGLSRVLRSKGYILNWRIGHTEDARKLHDEALSYLSEEHKAERAAILSDLARDKLSAGEPATSFVLFNQAMQIYEDLGDKEGQLAALINPGSWLYFDRGDFARSIAMLHRAAALARELDCKHQLVECNNTLSSHLLLWGRVEEARSYALQALEESRRLGCEFGEAFALMNLANATCELDGQNLDEALRWYKRALEIFETAGNRRFAVVTLTFMASALRRKGETLEAIQLGRRALALAKASTAAWIIAQTKVCLGAALVMTNPKEAETLLDEAIKTFQNYDDKYNLTFAFFFLAILQRREGRESWKRHCELALRQSKEGSYDYLFRREQVHALHLLLDSLEAGIEVDYVTELLASVGEKAEEPLIALLSHRDFGVRQRAMRALGRIGGERVRKILLRYTRLPFTELRREATTALARLAPPPHPLLAIRCFGSFSVTRGEMLIDESEWKRKKVKSLLKYLVCTPGLWATKEEIIEVFWPELDPDAAYNNFYRTLHHLRRILEPSFSPPNSAYVSFDGGIVRIIGDVVAWLDIDEFKRCLAEAKNAEVAGEADRAIVWRQAACELYRGDLMVDDLYEDWVQAKREQFREMQIGNLCKLSEHWARREKLDLAADYLRQILAIDPTREEIHLKLMTYLARAGNRTAALQQYKRCEKILKEELDAEPMPKTKAYYRKLLAGVTLS